jgi:hypothetical protein
VQATWHSSDTFGGGGGRAGAFSVRTTHTVNNALQLHACVTLLFPHMVPAGCWCCLLQDRLHGGSLRWWVWVEDPVLNRLHHAELWTLTKKVCGSCGSLSVLYWRSVA